MCTVNVCMSAVFSLFALCAMYVPVLRCIVFLLYVYIDKSVQCVLCLQCVLCAVFEMCIVSMSNVRSVWKVRSVCNVCSVCIVYSVCIVCSFCSM